MPGPRIGRLAAFFGAAALACGTLIAAEPDERAAAVGKELIAALGGESAWEKARVFRFDFVVLREGKEASRFRHAWDRYTGDYRLQGTDKTGAPYTVFFNVNTRDGKVLVNGRPAEGEARDSLLKSAYTRFINDSYWLLAPWKIFDPGVILAYDGEKPCPGELPGGAVCDVLRLSFGETVGLTPKDVYWLWITRDGRRMVQWQYVLGGAQEPPSTALWRDWQPFEGVSLALEKEVIGRPVVLAFENVSVSPRPDPALFIPPAASP
ncbi:MAG: hypothetical protein H7X85_06145 [Thermoanaerobaculia bacterium]|nr:hypothetical protein [Thermoanaerobaculia bacterium]